MVTCCSFRPARASVAEPEAEDQPAVEAMPRDVDGTTIVPRPLQRPVVVDRAISAAKLRAELDDWDALATTYWDTRRAVIIGVGGLTVDIAFAVPLLGLPAAVPPGGPGAAAMLGVAVRLDFTNYDLEPPSLTFIDPLTKDPAVPVIPGHEIHDGVLRNVVLGDHPITHLPFLCQPGIAEFHLHPQHQDESWLAEHRDLGSGRLANIVERVWRAMAKYGVAHLQPQMLQIPVPLLQIAVRNELFTDAGLTPPAAEPAPG